MVDLDLSPLLRDLCAKVAPIEARIAILDAEIAVRTQEVEGLRATLAGISRALDPEQVTLPLPGLGTTAPPPKLRRLTAKGEELLRAALANESRTVIVPRSVATRGATIAAEHLVGLTPPLLASAGTQSTGARLYKLTADGEAVARALPARVAP